MYAGNWSRRNLIDILKLQNIRLNNLAASGQTTFFTIGRGGLGMKPLFIGDWSGGLVHYVRFLP